MNKVFFGVVAAFIVSLAACDVFFGSTWGSPREYDSENAGLTRDNLKKYKSLAIGNPEFARAAGKAAASRLEELEEMKNELDTVRDEKQIDEIDQEMAEFLDAAVEFAWIGSELDIHILTHAGDMAALFFGTNDEDGESDKKTTTDNFIKSLGPLKERKTFTEAVDNFAVGAAACLDEDSKTHKKNPEFIGKCKDLVDAVRVDKAVLVLLAGIVDENDKWTNFGTIFTNFTSSGGDYVGVFYDHGKKPEPANFALAAYFNLMADDKNAGDEGEIYNNCLIASTIYDSIMAPAP